jgi:Cu-Zn family superoxide dismutase
VCTKNQYSACYLIALFSFCSSVLLFSGKTHGAPTDDPSQRMVGDLGNIKADEAGVCVVRLEDNMVKLLGPHSVIGRSVVICAGADDGGRGGQENSLSTGNSGPRVAYGVIGLAKS